MAEHRSAITRITGSSVARRRHWLIGAVGALGASGLILGGVGFPASADDVDAVGNVRASVEVQGGCVTAVVGSDGADGSVGPLPGTDASELQVDGQGTATVSVCGDDLGDPLPGDPGSLPGDLDDVVPEDLGDSLAGEVVGVVTAALEGELPGDGDGSLPGDPTDGLPDGLDDVVPNDPGGIIPGGDPGDDLPDDLGDVVPGDLGDVVPGGPGGLIPGGSGTDPGGLLDRLAEVLPSTIDGGGPGGNDGGPAVNTPEAGPATGTGPERGAPTDTALDGEPGHGGPAPVGTALPTGGTLPRTGGGLGDGVLRLIAFLGLGRVALGLVNRGRAEPTG